ncbi:MAG TPA: ribosomal protein S18-alanine N-acetyltransferase [Candidatus Marinimicrobia bacterium]|nr:ribosomal protein S18-alanine N-acetyltransferase [Candidatus Neomarinimicrobiota bacterium]HRS52579.1 ribosomal protein S18-alanine N-acetyltransferase [Candidatus Neomarinimicrobiota bacterium]HRU93173.1 ribosomal protein S18-alanine N-acetyltransferase [Candidatus Neomarinimicrobiota bacterium]
MAAKIDVRIRRADESDLPAILAIEEKSFVTAWTEDYFRHELYNPVSRFYVLEKEKKILGYIVIWLFADESHIANIAVHPEFRNAGLGGKLLNFSFEIAHRNGAKMITLEVNERNLAARRLYEKFQFVLTGRRAHYYENKDDALILTRPL